MKKSDRYLRRLLHDAYSRRSSEKNSQGKGLLSWVFRKRISRTRPGGDLRESHSSRKQVSPVVVSFPSVCACWPSFCLSLKLALFLEPPWGSSGLSLFCLSLSQTKPVSSWWPLLWEYTRLSELCSLCSSDRFADTWLGAKSTQNQTRKRVIFSCSKLFRKLYF